MAKRSYGQACSLARALDVVGERWTLLLVRELLTGPKRYKDLLHGLDGIGTNLLADRLKELEGRGVLQRARLPAPAHAPVYELTDAGRALEPAVLALVRWGEAHAPPARKDDVRRAHWTGLALKARFRPERAQGVDETYEVSIGEQTFHLRVREGEADAALGPAPKTPAVRLALDDAVARAIAQGRLDHVSALEQGRLRLEGDLAAFKRYLAAFALA